jgi:hypothetical protein
MCSPRLSGQISPGRIVPADFAARQTSNAASASAGFFEEQNGFMRFETQFSRRGYSFNPEARV